MNPRSGTTPRRELLLAVALCGAGAGLTLLASGRTWAHATVDLPRPLPDTAYALTGQQLAPLAGALGLAGLAGLAGLIATRGYARIVVAVLLAIIGAGAAYASFRGAGQGAVHRALAGQAVLVGNGPVSPNLTAWWAVSLAGGVLLVSAGVLTALRGLAWPGLSRKYDAPDASRPEAGGEGRGERAEHDMWDALDGGRDPTL